MHLFIRESGIALRACGKYLLPTSSGIIVTYHAGNLGASALPAAISGVPELKILSSRCFVIPADVRPFSINPPINFPLRLSETYVILNTALQNARKLEKNCFQASAKRDKKIQAGNTACKLIVQRHKKQFAAREQCDRTFFGGSFPFERLHGFLC